MVKQFIHNIKTFLESIRKFYRRTKKSSCIICMGYVLLVYLYSFSHFLQCTSWNSWTDVFGQLFFSFSSSFFTFFIIFFCLICCFYLSFDLYFPFFLCSSNTGRSRLPDRNTDWSFTIRNPNSKNDDQHLPIAHTCFFMIEMPVYSTDEIMRKRLLTACTYGTDITFA